LKYVSTKDFTRESVREGLSDLPSGFAYLYDWLRRRRRRREEQEKKRETLQRKMKRLTRKRRKEKKERYSEEEKERVKSRARYKKR